MRCLAVEAALWYLGLIWDLTIPNLEPSLPRLLLIPQLGSWVTWEWSIIIIINLVKKLSCTSNQNLQILEQNLSTYRWSQYSVQNYFSLNKQWLLYTQLSLSFIILQLFHFLPRHHSSSFPGCSGCLTGNSLVQMSQVSLHQVSSAHS